MRVLITGATGGLGYRTTELLAVNEVISSIKATGRTIKKSHFVNHSKVNYELGDLSSSDFVKSLVSDIDCVVHAAALSSPWGSEEAFYQANVQVVKNLLEYSKQNEVQRFVLISTPSIYFTYKNRFHISEQDPLPKSFVNYYAQTKFQAEQLVKESGLPYVILRPRSLVGRGDAVIMPRMIRAYKEKKLRIIGSGTNRVDLTSIKNVALAIELALFVEGTGLNEIYNISNGNPVVFWNVINDVLKALDKQKVTKKVPYGLALFGAQLMEWKAKLGDGSEPALTKYSVGILGKSFTMDISKAQRLLGYKPKVSIETAIGEFAVWYKQYLES